jgi:hypothetical protein
MRILILLLFPFFSYSQLTIGILESSRSAAYDPDAQAFFNRVSAATGVLTTTEKNAVNQLVLDLKSYGIWTKLDAAYPMVGSSAAACAQNLKSSSYTLEFLGGWVYNSSGIVPNGTNTYARTGYNTFTNGLQNDHHLSYYSKTNSDGIEVEIGAQSPTNVYDLLEIKTAGVTYPIINSAAFGTFADSDSRAFYLGNRTASNVMNGWRDSSKLVTYTGASSTPPAINIFIGALHSPFTGGPVAFTTKICAYASIGKGFTDTEAVNYYTAVTTFQTALSRQN